MSIGLWIRAGLFDAACQENLSHESWLLMCAHLRTCPLCGTCVLHQGDNSFTGRWLFRRNQWNMNDTAILIVNWSHNLWPYFHLIGRAFKSWCLNAGTIVCSRSAFLLNQSTQWTDKRQARTRQNINELGFRETLYVYFIQLSFVMKFVVVKKQVNADTQLTND